MESILVPDAMYAQLKKSRPASLRWTGKQTTSSWKRYRKCSPGAAGGEKLECAINSGGAELPVQHDAQTGLAASL